MAHCRTTVSVSKATDGVVRCMSFSYAAHGTSSPSRPPSIENMNYEGRACCRGKKSPTRVEVQTAPNYNE